MLLALDTSTRRGSVALTDEGKIVAYRALDAGAQHGTALAQAVADLGVDLERLDAFALTIGPGSFTGLRIALAFVKGLALVHPRPVLAVSTLEVMAQKLAEHREPARATALLPLLDARRSEAYAGLFDRRTDGSVVINPQLPEGVYPIGALADKVRRAAGQEVVLAGGEGVLLDFGGPPPWVPLAPLAGEAPLGPDARTLAEIADRRWRSGDRGLEAAGLEPTYLMSAPGEPSPAR